MLESPFSFSISPKPSEILMFRTFLAKILIFAYFPLKIGYFELGDDYDVTVTSYFGRWYLFWYVWKEETPSCGNHLPLVRRVTKKGLVRRGLKLNKFYTEKTG